MLIGVCAAIRDTHTFVHQNMKVSHNWHQDAQKGLAKRDVQEVHLHGLGERGDESLGTRPGEAQPRAHILACDLFSACHDQQHRPNLRD